jgi:hypothetical protein
MPCWRTLCSGADCAGGVKRATPRRCQGQAGGRPGRSRPARRGAAPVPVMARPRAGLKRRSRAGGVCTGEGRWRAIHVSYVWWMPASVGMTARRSRQRNGGVRYSPVPHVIGGGTRPGPGATAFAGASTAGAPLGWSRLPGWRRPPRGCLLVHGLLLAVAQRRHARRAVRSRRHAPRRRRVLVHGLLPALSSARWAPARWVTRSRWATRPRRRRPRRWRALVHGLLSRHPRARRPPHPPRPRGRGAAALVLGLLPARRTAHRRRHRTSPCSPALPAAPARWLPAMVPRFPPRRAARRGPPPASGHRRARAAASAPAPFASGVRPDRRAAGRRSAPPRCPPVRAAAR